MKSFRSTTLTALAVVLAAGLASSAKANSLTISRVYGDYFGAGGEFHIASNDVALTDIAARYSPLTGGIETFCLEENAYVSVPGVYTYQISDAAKTGGIGGAVNGSDPISVGSAWLYTQFATGQLGGYVYTPGFGRMLSAGLLQDAIWYLEDETYTTNPTLNPFLSAALGQFGGISGAKADNNGQYAAKVINMGVNSANQDQIVYVPDGGVTIALFGAALLLLGAIRRRLS